MKQLDPKAVWYFFISSHAGFIVIAIIWLSLWPFILSLGGDLSQSDQEFFSPLGNLKWAILLIPLILVIGFVWSKLTYHYYKYELREDGFRKESGVIYKKYVSIPYERIQNVDINRGILARLLGLSDLHIQTAGGSVTYGRYGAMGGGAEGRVPALSKEVAEQLRDELIKRARGTKHNDIGL